MEVSTIALACHPLSENPWWAGAASARTGALRASVSNKSMLKMAIEFFSRTSLSISESSASHCPRDRGN